MYRRTCDKCQKNIIAIYPEGSPLKIYCQPCWWSDAWDPMAYGFDYDFSKNFFEQFKDLAEKVPAMSDFNTSSLNSDYCNYSADCKNCYLFIGGRQSENVSFANRVVTSKDSLDLYTGEKLELCYEDVQCTNSYRLFFSRYSEDCSDSWFLYDCKNCQNCFGCTNLRGRQYYIFNQPYSKEEYTKKLSQMNLGSFAALAKAMERAKKQTSGAIHRYAHIINSPGSTGDNLYNAKNCKACFDLMGTNSENSKHCHYCVVGNKDSYDQYGSPYAEDMYETIAVGFESNENSKYRFSYFIKGSSDIWYSYNCVSSHNLFGCVGLRNKEYCIFNRQYSKEKYAALVPRIVAHMDQMPYTDRGGRQYKYGEFFPAELSPFAYNETIAQEYFPLTKVVATGRGLAWKDAEARNYQVTKAADDLPDHIKDVDDSILQEIVGCEHAGACNHQCTTAFRVTPRELQFYKQMELPLPRACPNCRHSLRLEQRNPLKLWKGKCKCGGGVSGVYTNTTTHFHGTDSCPNTFETSYAPDRPEIVYCEQCYQAEVA